MIYDNNFRGKLKIHSQFPREKLIQVFRPYATIYYKSKYAFGDANKYKYYTLLKNKMRQFIQYNPKFGRRTVDVHGNAHFNECCIDFYFCIKNSNSAEAFKTSHIKLEDSDNEVDANDFYDEEDNVWGT
jgi:hypothetical protein